MSEKTGFPWKTTLIIVIIFITLCCCLSAIIGAFVFILSQSNTDLINNPKSSSNLSGDQNDEDGFSAGMDSDLTGNQQQGDYSIFDDFSSNALDWYQFDYGSSQIRIEDESLSIHIKEPADLEYIYFPINFNPNEISFDMKGLSGRQDGVFGVMCNYLDSENYYYVEFDMATNEYLISEMIDDVESPLTEKGDRDYYWHTASELRSPTYLNHIDISCYSDSISLFINDKLIDQVDVSKPLEKPGDGGFYAYTWEDAGKNGYKIFIDNVEITQPQE